MIANLLSIAGSDPSGGAGIQADLKTFSALGAYGAAALTALTAQNTRGVAGIHHLPARFVAAQIDSLYDDLRIDAVKVGMLATAEVADIVAERLERHQARNIVLDPVMVATSGDRLLDAEAVDVIRRRLVPIAEVVTPNLAEAAVLLEESTADSAPAMRRAAQRLHRLGPRAVLLKGGHLPGNRCPDLLFDGVRMIELSARRVATNSTHGTGCTLSAAIAARLAQGDDIAAACRAAKSYLTAAIAAGDRLSVGSGHGPVNHFHALWGAE
jgi:hydroxymethylpyrimidine/phosphomethylpyrimidine kinase